MNNLDLWNRFADIDPKFTKPITGKQYKGTSPNPQYIIRCLTEMFGPVGKGFGWNVIAEAFTPLGDTTLHWCRIRFWWRDGQGENSVEQYGQTKAAYPTHAGGFTVDEDAPKKSLTDAVIKAASHLGIAANIFLGRWDDQKYVAEVNAEYRDAEKENAAQDVPPFNPRAAKIRKPENLTELSSSWKAEAEASSSVKDASPPMFAEINTAKEVRKAELQPKDHAS